MDKAGDAFIAAQMGDFFYGMVFCFKIMAGQIHPAAGQMVMEGQAADLFKFPMVIILADSQHLSHGVQGQIFGTVFPDVMAGEEDFLTEITAGSCGRHIAFCSCLFHFAGNQGDQLQKFRCDLDNLIDIIGVIELVDGKEALPYVCVMFHPGAYHKDRRSLFQKKLKGLELMEPVCVCQKGVMGTAFLAF